MSAMCGLCSTFDHHDFCPGQGIAQGRGSRTHLQQQLPTRLHHHRHARHVDREDICVALPELRVVVWVRDGGVAGVVDEDVDAAVGGGDRGQGGADRGRGCHVQLQGDDGGRRVVGAEAAEGGGGGGGGGDAGAEQVDVVGCGGG